MTEAKQITESLKTDILCVTDEKFSESLTDFLLKNNFNLFFSRGAIKAKEILDDEQHAIKLILWEIEHKPASLQYELAEMFRFYSSIPILIVSKYNQDCSDFSENIDSPCKVIDLLEGNRFILKELNQMIDPDQEEEAKDSPDEEEADITFNHLLSDLDFSKNDDDKIESFGLKKINTRDAVSANERTELLGSFFEIGAAGKESRSPVFQKLTKIFKKSF